MYQSGANQDGTFSTLGTTATLGSELTSLLMAEAIVPGSAPGYEICKTIYSYHPLGAILADAPIKRAQSQKRIISVPRLGEERIVRQYEQTWEKIGKVGATRIIRNLMSVSRIYGIGSLGIGERGKDSATPLDLAKIDAERVYFNVFDPLNTSGSLVLSQDPNSPDFLKQQAIRVNGKAWHESRTIAMLNEDPLFIEWSNSAFGFVGRSVYQRALYPLKTYLQTMVTDQWVTQKAGLIVAKMKIPGSIIDNLMQSFAASKRGSIKAGVTGQVLQIGTDEELESLNMEHLEPAARFSRENVLKNIASATGMPASIIAQETLTEGFGEGSEDAKKEAAYLNECREMMEPVYKFMDRIVMRLAWTPEFYETLAADYSEYASKPYETALHEWMRSFEATWPNILIEPESEKSKTADVQFKSVIALCETLLPVLDPENKAALIAWAAENVNEREELFASKLDLDPDLLAEYLEEQKSQAEEMAAAGDEDEEPKAPPAFSARS